MSNKINTITGKFIEDLIQERAIITMFLINGMRIEGLLVEYDENVILFKKHNASNPQMIYRKMISTITADIKSGEREWMQDLSFIEQNQATNLEYKALNSTLSYNNQLVIFLINGVKLELKIIAIDDLTIIGHRSGSNQYQIIFKHSISTINTFII